MVIAAFRSETHEFKYDVVDVKYFRGQRFRSKSYLEEASVVVFRLLDKLQVESGEKIQVCRGYIFDTAAERLKEAYGTERVNRIVVTGEPQKLTETAYLDEIRNLGYEPIEERDRKKAKSFFHMMNWLRKNPEMIRFAKTGWPRLRKYPLFKSYFKKRLMESRNC